VRARRLRIEQLTHEDRRDVLDRFQAASVLRQLVAPEWSLSDERVMKRLPAKVAAALLRLAAVTVIYLMKMPSPIVVATEAIKAAPQPIVRVSSGP
jgi:hypothetical protein